MWVPCGWGHPVSCSRLPSRRPLPVSPRPPSGIDTSRCWARQCRRTGETPVFYTSVCVCVTRETRLSLVPLDAAVTPVTFTVASDPRVTSQSRSRRLYTTISYSTISHHIPSYPIISHHIPPYPTISHHIPPYQNRDIPKIYARGGLYLYIYYIYIGIGQIVQLVVHILVVVVVSRLFEHSRFQKVCAGYQRNVPERAQCRRGGPGPVTLLSIMIGSVLYP